ncbi:oxidoreductase [Nitzschia inconspicua]|uniref:Oxidoreductase n=1 Tax=Nitzschia inconspicua TaxID=303405 RepID=A0A9K3LM31_9STRA|nr:oxidoreductase [Nitzschia inconspicua]
MLNLRSSCRKRKKQTNVGETMEGSCDDKNCLSIISRFRETTATDAQKLTDGVRLKNSDVILPWIGYGTYKLGKEIARDCTLEALQQGYRAIDTAFIYGGETTERQVGLAIQDAIDMGILETREDLCIITKHWRKYHGYEPALECLRLSLTRLNLDYVDLWLMHWPGPAWKTMNRRKDEMAKHGEWHYAVHPQDELPDIRAETWRAMEDAYKSGKVRAIGVCNFTIQHLERLKGTATIWPPAVNQIECHPIFPQTELVKYCTKEGIVVQAYSSLGGQDVGKKYWRMLYPLKKGQKVKTDAVTSLLTAPPVLQVAEQVNRTPAQVLLRWALEKSMVLVPKTSNKGRMVENAKALEFSLSEEQVAWLDNQFQKSLKRAAETEGVKIESLSRLCWKNDPLRDLDFE